jgi:heme O synthase-like polyprenyltransferase
MPKRFVSMPQAVLGVAFSFGIPMAFSAVTGDVPWLAWWLLAGNLFWVLAYDTEYAMVDRDDDLRIGMKTSAITLGRFDVAAVMAFYVVFLLFWALPSMKWSSSAIFMIAIVAALAQVAWHYMLIRTRQRDGCFKAFRLNHWLGFTVFAGIALSYRVCLTAAAPGKASLVGEQHSARSSQRGDTKNQLPNSSPSSRARCLAACSARMNAFFRLSCSIDAIAA